MRLFEVPARGIQSRVSGVVSWGLACLLLASRVNAQAGCVEVQGEVPPALSGCVTEQRLCTGYLRALVANSGDAEPHVVPLQVRFGGPASDATRLELDVFSDGQWLGRRVLSIRANDCAALPDALALVLVLLAQQAELGPDSPPSAAALSPPSPEPAAAAERPAEDPQPSVSGHLSLGAGAGLFIGALPSAALALQLQAATLAQPVQVRARATLLWPDEQRIAEGYVRMHDYELALEACVGSSFYAASWLSLRVCGGPRAGWMFVRARDFALRNDAATEFLLYLGVQPELGLALGPRTALQLGIAAALALIRPRFGVGLQSGERVSALASPSAIRAELSLTLVQIF